MNKILLRAHVKWAEAAAGPNLFPYRDTAKKLTIGYGHNLDDRGISPSVAELLLTEDLDLAIADAESLPYWDTLCPVRQLVLSDMLFNLGLTKFRKFVNLNKALLTQDYNLAAHEMQDSRWYRQTTRRAKVLVEAMRTGLWK